MFEALRQMTTRSPAGDLIKIAPGEPVVGFEQWPLANQIAAVTTHTVRRMQPGLSLAARANPSEIMQERDRLIAEAIKRHDEGAPVANPEQPAPEPDAPKPDALQCEECDYTTHSSQGLKTHKARKHR